MVVKLFRDEKSSRAQGLPALRHDIALHALFGVFYGDTSSLSQYMGPIIALFERNRIGETIYSNKLARRSASVQDSELCFCRLSGGDRDHR